MLAHPPPQHGGGHVSIAPFLLGLVQNVQNQRMPSTVLQYYGIATTDCGLDMATIAFIGLGNMGIGMAGRVLAAGHALQVYNRTASRAELLLSQGARLCPTPREACAGADAVIAMVADDQASRWVWTAARSPSR